MANWEVTTANSKLDWGFGYYNKCCKIDDAHYVNFSAGSGNDGYVQSFAVDTGTWAVTTASNALEFDTDNGQDKTCILIDDNHIIAFWLGRDYDGYTQVFEVNTTTWAVTTAASSLEFYSDYTYYVSGAKIDDNHFINFWRAGSVGGEQSGFVQAFEVNTSTWVVTTAANHLEFDTTSGFRNSCFQVDSNHFINFWTGVDTDGFVQTFEVNTSTWAITTAAASLEFDTSDCAYNACYEIDSTHFINFWRRNLSGYAQVFTVDTSTWAVSTAGAAFNFGDSLADIDCRQIDSNHFITFWSGVGADGFVGTFEVDTTTWAITTAASVVEYDTTNGEYSTCAQIDSSHYINFWEGSSGFAQVFEVELPSLTIGQKYALPAYER